ncbi:pyridoxal-phosphate dependent enzyme [Roseibium sp. MMSF_3544]|uniref:pyridoxal-phosphate dependent enzyme n=1 Tax=unclassified Roseibium TaxID=2629323 RepID=UPI00273EB257|nr:pyridoxal-phosphate dependent enzyme [Roseibium sp. MMSF_3544]
MSNLLVEKTQVQETRSARSTPDIARSEGRKASILEAIGETPVVRLNHVGPAHVELYAKLEAFNPMGSVKDRLALAVIEAAEKSGELLPGQTVIEATSGNTGIGLAMVCAQKGYPLVIVMAENFSVERRKLLRFLGAKVILTPAAERGTGTFRTAEQLAEKHGWFFCRQFENQANADIHRRTTGQEILNDFQDIGLDYWVTGFGTGGTLNGVARALKASSPETKIVVAEPENSQILNSSIPQLRRPDGAAARSHPNSRAHPIQGWSPDYIPKLAGDVHDAGLIDFFQPVSGADALKISQELARREGIFCGPSGGATVAAALHLASKVPPGSTILAMIPDTGERYLSTPLFERIAVDMTEEEKEIAASAPPPAKSKSRPEKSKPIAISGAARSFVRSAIHDPEAPVVMFGFEWCEFCWSVRRLFEDAGIPFKAIDVDSTDFRADDRGGDILRALFDETGMRTVPQVFVGGELIGGATEVLASAGNGMLSKRLVGLAKPIHACTVNDPMGYLPTWVRKPSAPNTVRGANGSAS